jgi:hypothetical protein
MSYVDLHNAHYCSVKSKKSQWFWDEGRKEHGIFSFDPNAFSIIVTFY